MTTSSLKALTRAVSGTLMLSVLLSSPVQADELQSGKDKISSSNKNGAASQNKIDGIDDQTRQMLGEYRSVVAETDQLKLYNRQMTEIVASQQEELANIEQQIKDVEHTERGILPLMNKMLISLKGFIELDLPFLASERQTRLNNLMDLMNRADVTVSEKYRRILEAYQIEIEYGRTLEAYREQADDQVTYDFLRIGRTALYRLSLSGDQAWLWNKQSKQWDPVDDALLADVRKALKVARQTAAPELLTLPMPVAAKEAAQ